MKEKEVSYYSKRIRELCRVIENLAPKLPYHNKNHLKDVSKSCKKYAQLERLNLYDIFILETAGLLHDIVYLPGREDNVERSVELSKNVLSRFGYSQREIEEISRLILSTKLPTNPRDALEKIICDADLDNLGRDDFFEKTELLRLEQGILDKKKWYTDTLNFLEQVEFYTPSARRLAGPKLKENIEKMRRLK